MGFKKILAALGVTISFVTPLSIIACDKKDDKREVPLFGNNKYSVKRFIMDESINKRKLSLLTNLNNYFKTDLLVGGFGEGRSFYSGAIDSNIDSINYHMGDDILSKANTKVIANSDSEVLSAWWYGKDKVEIADGVGGEILVRTPIKNLDIKPEFKKYIFIKKMKKTTTGIVIKSVSKVPKIMFVRNGKFDEKLLKTYTGGSDINYKLFVATEQEYQLYIDNLIKTKILTLKEKKLISDAYKYVYSYFIHLSKSSLNLFDQNPLSYNDKYSKTIIANVDFNKTIKLKKGDTIGFVGNTIENGGWFPHVHIETYLFEPIYSSRIYRAMMKYKIINKDKYKSRLRIYSKAVGTIWQSSKDQLSWDKLNMSFQDYQMFNKYLVKPNNIYNYYNNETEIKHIDI